MPDNAQGIIPEKVETFLDGQVYPCTNKDLMRTASANGAGPEVLEILERLPPGHYASPMEVSEAVERLKM